jgi:hypothetical protein
MSIIDNEMLWRQFGAAIDMFGTALCDYPDSLWEKKLWKDQPVRCKYSVHSECKKESH